MPSTSSRLAYLGLALALVVAALLLSWSAVAALGLPRDADEFNLVRWELRHLPNKWIFQFGSLFRSRPDSVEEKDRAVRRFLALTADISRLDDEVSASGSPELEAKQRERQDLENTVEWILEERVSAVARDLDLERTWPVLGLSWLFPPVDFEFAEPPRVLATSPRDRIFLQGTTLLRSDLTLQDMVEIEAGREAGGVSALVVGIGGVGTYPSIVPPRPDYESTVEAVAHEWLHHYLFFKPLGFHYFRNPKLRTLNETVADIAGREMAALVVERYPLQGVPDGSVASRSGDGTEGPDPDVDFNGVMQELRRDVERLLAGGRVEEAEALMESRRLFLVEHGFRIRRINQAYFAFHGIYADRPASIDAIGPKARELRERAGSLGEFIRLAAGLTSEGDLDRLLASLR